MSFTQQECLCCNSYCSYYYHYHYHYCCCSCYCYFYYYHYHYHHHHTITEYSKSEVFFQQHVYDETGRLNTTGCQFGILLPTPLKWSSQSPNLISCDNALWGHIKQKVAQNRYQTTEELKDAVRNVFASITPTMLRKISHRSWKQIILCHENNSVQTDPLE
ncbi:hypothetical protein ANN_04385 [Periplaneta americana]|uniref:Uncharacterized protein n=1 Tax=Periplaneta americana TaxID=6978 RepID=A0ABQ8TA87_PERAM|nr:hypothetical protein ANN_04385 [Periplaneta americana]